MSERDFRDVRVAVIEGNPRLRNDLHRALQYKGINNPVICTDPESFLNVAGSESLDVIVCDASYLGGDFPAEMQRIRRDEAGGNPFVVAIATVHDANAESVRGLLECGIDDLLVKPTPIPRIIERIDHMVSDRRPFVVTTGYVGPSRRNAKRPTDDGEAVLDAPNTLHCKVVEKMKDEEIGRLMNRAKLGLQDRMAQHPLLGIDRLIQRTMDYSRSGNGAEELRRDFGYLMKLSVELSNRYRGTTYAHIADLAVALADLAKRISASSPKELRTLDLEPLSRLGEVIRRSIAAEERRGDAAPTMPAAAANPTGLRFTAPATRH